MVGLINKWVEQAQDSVTSHADALAHLKAATEPSRKTEMWRYSDVARLQALPQSVASDQTASEANWVLVISAAGITGLDALPSGIEVQPIGQTNDLLAVENHSDLSHVLYNQAAYAHGVHIHVTDQAPDGTLQVRYEFSGDQWQLIRNQIRLASGAQIKLSEVHAGGHLNLVNVFDVASHAELQREQCMRLDAASSCLSFNQYELGDRAQVKVQHHHQGGHIQHHMNHVNLNGQHAEYVAGSVNKGFANNNIADLVHVNHANKNNRSEVTHRSIANDQSQVFNQATAVVAVGADQSEIAQDLKNILLSEDAKIFSKPALEVYADEVVAAHGSTIGALDDQALFYLQSRGIDLAKARDIMIESFEEEAQVC